MRGYRNYDARTNTIVARPRLPDDRVFLVYPDGYWELQRAEGVVAVGDSLPDSYYPGVRRVAVQWEDGLCGCI